MLHSFVPIQRRLRGEKRTKVFFELKLRSWGGKVKRGGKERFGRVSRGKEEV